MILQELPQILYDKLGCTCLAILLEALVDADDIHQLMREVVLASLARFERDGRPHGDWRHGQHSQNHPFRSRCCGVHAHDLNVVIRDLLKAVANIRCSELMPGLDVGKWPLELDLLLRSAAIRTCLVLAGLGEDLVDGVVCHLAELLQGLNLLKIHIFLIFLEHKAGAVSADRPQDLSYQFGKAHVNDRCYEIDVAEVAWALTRSAAAGAAAKARVDYAQSRVHQTHLYGKTVVVISICRNDLDHAHLPELLGRDKPEADFSYSLGNCHIST
ncbi:Uncharacterised protein [uncultured archaeon]|nr:Uncharacterised protein [uncultured archaeon]